MDVLIASGRPNLRFSLEVFLRQQSGIVVLGTVSNTESLLAIIHATRFDVVVMEWELSGSCSPVEVLSEAKTVEHPPHFVILGKDIDRSQAALDTGAVEFLLQWDSPADLLAAIRRAGATGQAPNQEAEDE